MHIPLQTPSSSTFGAGVEKRNFQRAASLRLHL
ncbi:hypothetical protein TSAR_001193 [Trichomalopsis sarcophagae]|uniref:Uncharacterized protein n=1 Tax=Trichomalopsis sarcophagae TaxID=543379 RepID=A0A232FFH4_9HYME|nr:hypothetical protein TSAR_001193 [Trichomalopsis sarcophagae]